MLNFRLYFLIPLLVLAAVPSQGQTWLQATAIAGDIKAPEAGNPAAILKPAANEPGLSPAQKKRADMLISIFENSALEPQYGYIEDLGDGRGYTAGRAGFCSGCGDLLLVVERYINIKPNAPLAKYLPRLKELAGLSSDSTKGLEGFPKAWQLAAQDKLFCEAQDAVSDDLYYRPALNYSAQLGLRRDFSKVALYEAAIQHGTGSDPDGLGAMIKKVSKAVKPPSAGGDEKAWLNKFLKIRKATLAHASDPATSAAWAESVGRADAMLAICASGNMDFSGPVTVNPYGGQFTIP